MVGPVECVVELARLLSQPLEQHTWKCGKVGLNLGQKAVVGNLDPLMVRHHRHFRSNDLDQFAVRLVELGDGLAGSGQILIGRPPQGAQSLDLQLVLL